VEVKLSHITGIVGKTKVVKKNKDETEMNDYYRKSLKTDRSEEDLELMENELIRPVIIETLEIIYKSSMHVDMLIMI